MPVAEFSPACFRATWRRSGKPHASATLCSLQRRIAIFPGQLRNPPGDSLPGLDACLVAGQRQGPNLFGDMVRGLVAMHRQNLIGTSPEFPLAEHQRNCPASPRSKAMKP